MDPGVRGSCLVMRLRLATRDWYFIAEQPAPAPHLARPEGRVATSHAPKNMLSCLVMRLKAAQGYLAHMKAAQGYLAHKNPPP